MSHSGSLEVVLTPSRSLCIVLAGVHGATLLPLWWAGLPGWVGMLLALAIGVHCLWAVRRFALLRSAHSVTAIALRDAGGCALGLRSGEAISGSVDPAGTVVFGSLVILGVRRAAIRPGVRVLIAADMLPDELFRRLRIGLKWGGAQPDAGHA